MKKGAAKAVYQAMRAKPGIQFDGDDLAAATGLSRQTALAAASSAVRSTMVTVRYPGIERVGLGVFVVNPPKPPHMQANPDASGLLLVKVLTVVDGRTLVQDDDTKLCYWMEPIT